MRLCTWCFNRYIDLNGDRDFERKRQATTHWLALVDLQRREDVIPYSGKLVISIIQICCVRLSQGFRPRLSRNLKKITDMAIQD